MRANNINQFRVNEHHESISLLCILPSSFHRSAYFRLKSAFHKDSTHTVQIQGHWTPSDPYCLAMLIPYIYKVINNIFYHPMQGTYIIVLRRARLINHFHCLLIHFILKYQESTSILSIYIPGQWKPYWNADMIQN